MKLIFKGIVFLIGYYSCNFGMIEPLGSTRKRTFFQITPQDCNNSPHTGKSSVSEFEDFSLKKRFDSRLGREFKDGEELNLDSKMAQMQNIPLLLQQICIPYAESQKKVSLALKKQIPSHITALYPPAIKLQNNIYQCHTAFEQAFLNIDNFLIEKCIKYSCYEYLNKEAVKDCNGYHKGSSNLTFFVEDTNKKIKNIIIKWDMLKARVTFEESCEINKKIKHLNSIHFFSAIQAMDRLLNQLLKDLEPYRLYSKHF